MIDGWSITGRISVEGIGGLSGATSEMMIDEKSTSKKFSLLVIGK